jgi:hypothetical protein
MEQVNVQGRQIAAKVRRRVVDSGWDGRESYEITMLMSSQEAAELFVHDVAWSKTMEVADLTGLKTVETDMSEFSLAGPIIDNRDGTVTVKMGKLTDAEALQILMGGATE